MHEKDGNSMNDDNHLPLERRASHVSACADLDKGTSVSRSESRDIKYKRYKLYLIHS